MNYLEVRKCSCLEDGYNAFVYARRIIMKLNN